MDKKDKPHQLENLLEKIHECIDNRHYTETIHAVHRKTERDISLLDALYVLKNGYHEKNKTSFDNVFKTWKYAIRGKTLDDITIRVIIAFNTDGMIIITVIKII